MNTPNLTRRQLVGTAGVLSAALLGACGAQQKESTASDTAAAGSSGSTDNSGSAEVSAGKTNLALDETAWQYNADDDVYYQLGISYCETPADESYETLAILVPGAYFKATNNGDDTFSCEVDPSATVGSYTAATAPIVMPINTPGYSAQSPMSAYSSQAAYTGAGMVYVHAGCRGRDAGAPAGITDLKAAVRFLRVAASKIAGNTDRIFTFGMSGGGAQSALMGATGNSELYEPYLSAIGAASDVSDAVYGSMDWCPITGLDVADEAYEWMMGCTRSGLSDTDKSISDELARAYVSWVNTAGITDANGAALKLSESSEGIYQAGSYYEQVRATIEESLNNFLADTTFPYDASSANKMGGAPDGMGGGMGGGRPDGMGDGAPDGMGDGQKPDFANGGPGGQKPDGAPNGKTENGSADGNTENSSADGMEHAEQNDNISRTQATGGVSVSGIYETVADYIAALNADGEWVTYDDATKTATISSVADFCVALKQASKSLGAFDQLDRGQGENTLFGENGTASHFDAMLAQILEEQGSEYASDFANDLAKADSLGTSVQTRVNMYTPLYYVLASQEGYGTSEPAKHWRIRTGIEQGDTSLTTEMNLALALKANPLVESVDFATVWGQGHTQAERTGSASENFIAWVADCMG